MVKTVSLYRNNEYIFIPLVEYLSQYHNQLPEGWTDLKMWIDRIFEKNADYKELAKEMQVEYFDIKAIKEAFDFLKSQNYNLDEDILRFIAFLFGTSYYTKIGKPTIDLWLNASDLSYPFKTNDIGNFSCMDVAELQYGQNAIRKKLMATLKWIGSQSGS